MKVLVLGGTRGLGRDIAVAAHAAGHTLTVLARRPGELGATVSGVRMVVGDLTDAQDVERAVAGQDAVVWAVRAQAGVEVQQTNARGMQVVLGALATLGVRRFVYVVQAGGSRLLPLLPARRARAADAVSTLLGAQVRTSDREWTILRPGPLTEGAATGLYQVLTEAPTSRVRAIARADVAAFAVECLATPEHVRDELWLCG